MRHVTMNAKRDKSKRQRKRQRGNNGTPTRSEISRVMSALGKRNKGRPKAMSPMAISQRRMAGLASARARGFHVVPTLPLPLSTHTRPPKSQATLAQSGIQTPGQPGQNFTTSLAQSGHEPSNQIFEKNRQQGRKGIRPAP